MLFAKYRFFYTISVLLQMSITLALITCLRILCLRLRTCHDANSSSAPLAAAVARVVVAAAAHPPPPQPRGGS